MTDREIHEAVAVWIASVTGAPSILAYQGGPKPGATYTSVALTAVREIGPHARDMEYSVTGTTAEGRDEITETPLIDTEWQFSVTGWGDAPEAPLRALRSALHIKPVADGLHPLKPNELGRINTVPEYIDEAWHQRAQAPLFVRGVTRDGLVIDTVETVEGTANGRAFSVTRPA